MRTLAFSVAALSLSACGFMVAPSYQPIDATAARAQAQASVDDVMLQRIESSRRAAKTGGADEAWTFAKNVETAYQTHMVSRGKVDGPALVTEATADLDAAASSHPTDAPKMLAAKGSLLFVSGDKAGAKVALEASFKTPNLWPVQRLLALYDSDSDKAAITRTCTKARAVTTSDDERYAVLDECLEYMHAASVDAGLSWAPKGDVAFYKQQKRADEERAARENEERRQKADADRAAMQASFNKTNDDRPSSGSSSSGSSGSSSGSSGSSNGPVSVTIRSSCPQTVKVFYGNTPKYGSGTNSSISSNSVNSHSFQPGDMFWTVDDSGNGLGSTTISSSTRQIEIGSDCRSMRVN